MRCPSACSAGSRTGSACARSSRRSSTTGARRSNRSSAPPARHREARRLTILHWFRRDLRIADNTALAHAARDAGRVIPVFVLDDHYAHDPNVGPARFRFLRESLEHLERALPLSGGRLIVRSGPAARALPDLLAQTGA